MFALKVISFDGHLIWPSKWWRFVATTAASRLRCLLSGAASFLVAQAASTLRHFGFLYSRAARSVTGLASRRYKYPPLTGADDDARFFELLPGEFDDDIYGRLVHRSVDSFSAYEALSYTFDDAEGACRIFLEGRHLNVAASLGDALRRLRRTDEVRMLWIDAICINQDDCTERDREVFRICDIFANSKSVIIWLGEDQGDDPNVAHVMDIFDRLGPLYPQSSKDESSTIDPIMDTEHMMACGAEVRAADTEVVEALVGILQDPWWFRVWVAQEVCVAKQWSARVMRGARSVPWYPVLGVAYAWMSVQYSLRAGLTGGNDDGGEDDDSPELRPVGGMNIVRSRRVSQTERPVDLLDLLWMNSLYPTPDPRDRIYALLGMSGDAKALGIVPDYSLSVEKVFIDVAKRHVEIGHSLNILAYIQHPRRVRSLPGWVPDWTADFAYSFLIDITIAKWHDDNARYRACGGTPSNAVVETRYGRNRLHTRGFSFSRIKRLGGKGNTLSRGDDLYMLGRMSPDGETSLSGSHTFDDWLEMALMDRGVAQRWGARRAAGHSVRSSVVEAFCRTLVANRTTNGKLPKPRAWTLTNDGSTTGAEDLTSPQPPYSFGLLDFLDMGNDDGPGIFDLSLRLGACYGRRLAVLEGGYLALVPPFSQIGDEVLILMGCDLPIVLRRSDKTLSAKTGLYRLIGVSYVHGASEGELMDENEGFSTHMKEVVIE